MARSGQCNLTTGRIATAHWYSPCRLRQCAPHLIHAPLGPPESKIQIPNGVSIGSAVFAQLTAECPYTVQWSAHSPSKLALPMWDLDLHLIHGSLGPPQSLTQMASRSVQPFLQGSLLWHTDRRTNHATRSVIIGRIYVYVVLRCGLII